jgi:hypothetical protein
MVALPPAFYTFVPLQQRRGRARLRIARADRCAQIEAGIAEEQARRTAAVTIKLVRLGASLIGSAYFQFIAAISPV